jgi:sigma-B regulation protein RsbU (phosphoserine phosphatase)
MTASDTGDRRRTPDAVQRLISDFRDLLGPGTQPEVAGLEIDSLYRTRGDDERSELGEIDGFGGDFVDFLSQGGLAQIVVTLGDVRGKGVGAAARAIMTKYLIRAIVAAQRWPPLPGEALRDIHNALLALPHEPHDFVTVCIASVDARSGVVGLATAGHPSPIAVRRDRIERPLLFGNPALGVTEEAELQTLPTDYVELGPGDALLLYTDGLSDVRDDAGRFYEDARLDQRLAESRDLPGAALLQGLLDDATAFGGHAPADDVALVLIRRSQAPTSAAAALHADIATKGL